MTFIKNLHLLEGIVSETEISKLEHAALQYRKYSRIKFKVTEFQGDAVKIQTIQDKSPHDNHLDIKELIAHTKGMFNILTEKNITIHVGAVPYKEDVTDVVDDSWLRANMARHKVKLKDIVDELGVGRIEATELMEGQRGFTKRVKAMFYYYFYYVAHNGRG